ncbi:MAG: response regulator [Magnetococcus sp. DMHC-6]
MNTSEIYITTSKAGHLLGVSQRTIHYWLERGVLKSWKTVGGHCRIPMSSVQELLNQRQIDLKNIVPAPFTLLLVEDDAQLREMFKEIISNWDLPLQLIMATNGYDGLIQVGLHKPQLILTDLVMPVMDGLKMISTILSNPDVQVKKIIVITGLTTQQVSEKGGVPDGVLLMHKPIFFKELKLIVQEFLLSFQSSTTLSS